MAEKPAPRQTAQQEEEAKKAASSGTSMPDPNAYKTPERDWQAEAQAEYERSMSVTPEQQKQWAQEALEREQASARSRGVEEEVVRDYQDNLVYIMSNRLDSRGYQEFDERHPGGYMAIGGDHVDLVYRETPMVQDLLRQGLAIEVPEPVLFIEQDDPTAEGGKKIVRNPFAPAPKVGGQELPNAFQPGQEIQLGRPLSKRLFTNEQRRSVHRLQQRGPQAIAVPRDAIVPPKSAEDTARERRAVEQQRAARDAQAAT